MAQDLGLMLCSDYSMHIYIYIYIYIYIIHIYMVYLGFGVQGLYLVLLIDSVDNYKFSIPMVESRLRWARTARKS